MLGSLEKQNLLRKKLKEKKGKGRRNRKRRNAILDCLDEVDELNTMLGFIIGRMGQFLQG
jgi:hypothetical protein